MAYIRAYSESPLDKIRIDRGIAKVKEIFIYLLQSDMEKGLELINDDRVNYGSIFLIRDEIKSSGIKDKLSVRNKTALDITELILSGRKSSIISGNTAYDYIQIVHSTLNWMLWSGAYDDGLNDEYDEVLDITAAIIVDTYRDKTVLPVIADLIFSRNRRDSYKYDLIWAFFEGRDPNSLTLIANYLKSILNKDVKLARRLLSFIPGLDAINDAEREKQYRTFSSWIEDNKLFLFYKGETFQQTNKPTPYTVISEAKYLCKIVSVDTGEIMSALGRDEKRALESFMELDNSIRLLLSNFSNALHNKDRDRWNEWLRLPVEEQIRIAELGVL